MLFERCKKNRTYSEIQLIHNVNYNRSSQGLDAFSRLYTEVTELCSLLARTHNGYQEPPNGRVTL